MSSSIRVGAMRRHLIPATLALIFTAMVSIGIVMPASASTTTAATTRSTAPAAAGTEVGSLSRVTPQSHPSACNPMQYCGPFVYEVNCERARAHVIALGHNAREPCFYWSSGGVPDGYYFFWFR
jgi:hypothetical protein